jgi:radical SAM protein with 4Fe4S-binding SPASM domain
MCGQWGETGSSKYYTSEILRQKLSFDLIKKLIDEVKYYKPNITLFGGEPLIHTDWKEIVRYVKDQKLRCNLITNGTMLDQYSQEIVDSRLDEIILSLDGPEEVHDEMRRKNGTFRKLFSGVQKINYLKEYNNKNKPIININATIFETNYKYLEQLIVIAEKLQACTLTFHHLIFTNNEIYQDHSRVFKEKFNKRSYDWEGFIRPNLPDINTDELLKIIERIKNSSNKIPVSFYPNFTNDEIRAYYSDFHFVPQSYKRRCLSPWMVTYIFPDGSVRPCLSLNYITGSIKADRFKDIWNNEMYRSFRKTVKTERSFPVCTRCTEFYRF